MSEGSTQFYDRLLPILKTLELRLDEGQLQLLKRHFDLLLKWNKSVNLTSVRDPAEIVRRHFGESLFAALALPARAASVLDVGSGAGFPGLPVAVVRPGAEVTLVESVGKKVAFLKEAGRAVPNLSVRQGRFEDLPGHFDWVTLRGVSLKSILPSIFQRADHLAILTAGSKLSELSALAGVKWDGPRLVPWDPETILMTGSVVPRGTGQKPDS